LSGRFLKGGIKEAGDEAGDEYEQSQQDHI
jgi:hypothetical protein